MPAHDFAESRVARKAVGVVSHEDREPLAAHIHLVDLESGKEIREFTAERMSAMEYAFSADGKLMASGGYDCDKDRENYFARLWDVETGKEIRRFMHGKQGFGIASLAFSPDGRTLATLGTQAGVLLRLFNVDTGKLLKAFPKDDGVRPDRGSVAFSPDGKTVAAATNSIRLYDPTTGVHAEFNSNLSCNVTVASAVSGHRLLRQRCHNPAVDAASQCNRYFGLVGIWPISAILIAGEH